MAPSETLKILVSGGGVAGACAAYWLSRSKLNVAVTIIERSPEPRVTGQAVDIRGRAIEIVDMMGLKEIILSKNTTETATAFIDSKGNISALFEANGDKSATSEFEILRADLAQTFLDAVSGRPNVECVYGTTIESLTQKENGVSVTFSNGRKTEDYHVVVGADGLGSKTRSLAFPKSMTENPYYSLGQYVAYFSIPSISEDNKYWNWYATPKGRTIMIRPHRDPRTMGVILCVTMPTRSGSDPELVKATEKGTEAVKQLLYEYFKDVGWQAERVVNAMMTAEDFYINKWDQVRLPQWTTGNIALIGDAAVATPGAGTSYAIETAYLLAGELSKISNLQEIPQALQEYEKVFRPAVSQTLLPGAPQILNPQTSWGIWIMNTLLWSVEKTRLHKLALANMQPEIPKWQLPEYDWE